MRLKLIENWAQNWWRLWSVRLAFVVAMLGALAPALLQQLAQMAPEPYRPVAVFAVMFIIPTLVRLTTQAKLVKRGA